MTERELTTLLRGYYSRAREMVRAYTAMEAEAPTVQVHRMALTLRAGAERHRDYIAGLILDHSDEW